MAQATGSTSTWRRSTSWRSRSASTGRRVADDAGDRLPRRRDARRLARVGRRDAEAARGGGPGRARRAQGGAAHRGGAARARKVVRKHRIIERLLTDFMGYTAAEAHVHADELGGTFTDEMIERIDERLGHPEPLPARLAGRPGLRAGGEPRARAAVGRSAGRVGDDRAARRARRRASALVLRRGARARRGRRAPRSRACSGAVPRRGRRRREGDRRTSRGRLVRPPLTPELVTRRQDVSPGCAPSTTPRPHRPGVTARKSRLSVPPTWPRCGRTSLVAATRRGAPSPVRAVSFVRLAPS